MKNRCAELCEVILLATSVPEPIWRWPRTLRSREPWRSQNAGASSRFLNLEDSITDTSATPLRDRSSVSAIMVSDILPWTCEPTQSVRQPRPHLFPGRRTALCALCFATRFLDTALPQGCLHQPQNFASRSRNRYLCLARNPHSSKVTRPG